MTDPRQPACMDPDEVRRWWAANGDCDGNRAKSPCADCLPEWRDACAREGLCDAEVPGQLGMDLFEVA